MALRDENILGFVENISKFLNAILFSGLNLDVKDYENFEELVDLKLELKNSIKEKKLKQAQEKLFEQIKLKNKSHDVLRVGFWFYLKLNELDDETLKEGGLVRQDVLNGMKKIEEFLVGDFEIN